MDKYLSPVSGKSTTTFLPAFSSRSAIVRAAHMAAPEDIPTSTPSDLATSLADSKASSFFTVIISS